MNYQNEDIHQKIVSSWEESNAKDLTPEQHLMLLEKAIVAIEERSLSTLSSITLEVVLDRILHQGLEN